MPSVLGVIPARYASTRFPGKPLAVLGRRTLVEQVWRSVAAAKRIDRLIVASEDRRVVEAARGFGAEALLTSPEHASGTDRVAEVVAGLDAAFELVVNVQGDEPFVTPTAIDRLLAALAGGATEIATLAEPLESVDELLDPNVVKVVVDVDGRALYFSRSPIPFPRSAGGPAASALGAAIARRPGGLRGYRKHQGIYGYTAAALRAVTQLPPSPLELDEGLEQLRALEHGMRIRVVDSDFRSIGVDTPEDLRRAAARLERAPGGSPDECRTMEAR